MNEWIVKLGKKIETIEEDQLIEWSSRISANNPWFTKDNIKFALVGWAQMLNEKSVNEWLGHYKNIPAKVPKNIGVVMAGNIPFAGFHDMICVLASGHKLKAKRSSQDLIFPQWILTLLTEIDSEVAARVEWVDKIENIDAVIATGSGNTARYFHYYFSKWPHIIRSNRTSVAILTGEETDEELKLLAKDVFTYFGLGCRNVSKLFLPEGKPLEPVLRVFEEYYELKNHNKYANNYDYNRSVYLLNLVPIYDNNVVLMKEDTQLASPLGVLFYEYYKSINQLQLRLETDREKIQCMVSKEDVIDGTIALGQAQCPSISDYADGVDTMAFLLNL
jgi:hypothetical protein